MDEITQSYNKAVAELPDHLRSRVDEFQCSRPAGSRSWDLRDKHGDLLIPLRPNTAKPEHRKAAPGGMTPKERELLMNTFRGLKASIGEIQELDEVMAEVVGLFDDRLKSLEAATTTKALDAEAYDAMTEMAERVESLEATLNQIADGAIRFRGYWRDGDVAQKGDAFSHNGSTYRANCDTETEPGTAGGAWTTIARGASTQKGSR